MNAWSDVREGTAVGPSTVVETSNGDTIVVTTLWSDEEGVGVSLDISPDAVVPAVEAMALVRAIQSMLAIDPPQVVVTEDATA